MNKIRTEFIEKIIDIMRNNELTEVTLENGDSSLYISSNGIIPKVIDVKADIEPQEIKEEIETEKVIEENKKIIPVVSNMIGLYFSKPSPKDAPFVSVGDKVEKGQQICIIETIKLMNKITSEVSGTIKEICIEDGKPVEYGQTIMLIEQDIDNV